MLARRTPLPYALAVNYAAMVSLAVAVNLLPVFLTTLSTSLGQAHGLTTEQLGRIGAATFIGVIAGFLIGGPLVDRLGARCFAILGNLLVAGGLAMLGLATNYTLVLLAAGVMGCGAGMLDMVLSPIVCAFQPHRRTTAMSWLHAFYCLGAVCTVLSASLALRCGCTWRAISLCLLLLPVIVALGFLGMTVPPLIRDGELRQPLRELCGRRFFLAALLAIFLAGSTEIGLAQWLPAYAETSLHFSKWIGGMALLCFSLAMMLGRMLAGMLGTRVRPLTLMIGGCWAAVACYLLACFSPWPVLALGASVAVGLTGSILWPNLLGVTADRFPRGGAGMFWLLSMLGNLGGVFMPWLTGVIAERTTLHLGIAAATFCPFLLALLLMRMRRGAPLPHPAADSTQVAGIS